MPLVNDIVTFSNRPGLNYGVVYELATSPSGIPYAKLHVWRRLFTSDGMHNRMVNEAWDCTTQEIKTLRTVGNINDLVSLNDPEDV